MTGKLTRVIEEIKKMNSQKKESGNERNYFSPSKNKRKYILVSLFKVEENRRNIFMLNYSLLVKD